MISPSPSVDPVRERIAEMQQRMNQTVSEEMGSWMLIDLTRSDFPALVAALTAVLDEFDYYSENGTEDEQDVIAAIRRKLAAGLGVTP